jgi:hypothetical protein
MTFFVDYQGVRLFSDGRSPEEVIPKQLPQTNCPRGKEIGWHNNAVFLAKTAG